MSKTHIYIYGYSHNGKFLFMGIYGNSNSYSSAFTENKFIFMGDPWKINNFSNEYLT